MVGCAMPPDGASETASQAASIAPVCATAAENENAVVKCPSGRIVTGVIFASYGTATGSCGSFATSSCNASDSGAVVSNNCLGRSSCTLSASNATFGDPCHGTRKQLEVQVTCGLPAPSDAGNQGSTGVQCGGTVCNA